MRYVSVSPFSSRNLPSVRSFFDEFDNLFDNSQWQQGSRENTNFSPAVEIQETNEHYLFSMDVPGIAKEDLNIDLQDGELTISGERKSPLSNGAETKGAHRVERFYGRFERRFKLPREIDFDKIEANHHDGVLDISLPKKSKAAKSSIAINGGERKGFLDKLIGEKEVSKETKSTKE